MLKYTFPRKLRLNKDIQFKQAFTKSKKISIGFCGVFCFANNLNYARLGVIVQKKNISAASRRNWFKRQVRECFRLLQHDLVGFDIVILAYKEANKITSKELQKKLEIQWKKTVFQ